MQNAVSHGECGSVFFFLKMLYPPEADVSKFKGSKNFSHFLLFRRFCEALVRNGQQRGIQMNMPPRVDNFEETSVLVGEILSNFETFRANPN